MRRSALLGAAFLLALAPGTAAAREPRPYSLSLAVEYGEQRDRASYLAEIQRSIETWIAATGPLNAPTAAGEADLHLRVVVRRIEVKHNYPEASREPDVFADTRRPGYPQGSYSTLFETEIEVSDPRAAEAPLVRQPLSVFNEQFPSELVPDPKERSWRVNLDYLNDRIGSLLGKHRKAIERHLRSVGRLS